MYNLVVNPTEFRLIQKALRGVLTEEEKPEALALQQQMMEARFKQAEQLAEEAAKPVSKSIKDSP
jgi:hypothetical protein